MAILIIGPSSVGKPTFLKQENLGKFGLLDRNIVFGYQIGESPIQADSLIHYNMLHLALKFSGNYAAANKNWDFWEEPVFAKIIGSGLLERAIVLVSPKKELIERMRHRTVIESDVDAQYDSATWVEAATHLDLYRIYEDLFDLLESQSIPYTVFFSSETANSPFLESDRVFVHANLKGRFVNPPSREAVTQIANNPQCQYQSVKLPWGISTSPQGYKHLGDGRHLTFQQVLRGKLEGSSILDVGSAMGDLLFTAERLGADELVGIELHAGRYSAAQSIATLLESKAEFYNINFFEFDSSRSFDHVYLLNVIHHVHDFDRFIRKAAQAALQSLTIEFPTLTDPKFRAVYGFSREAVSHLNESPFIGLSSMAHADQSYVYAPAAIERLVMNEIGGFNTCTTMASPIQDRVIMVFER